MLSRNDDGQMVLMAAIVMLVMFGAIVVAGTKVGTAPERLDAATRGTSDMAAQTSHGLEQLLTRLNTTYNISTAAYPPQLDASLGTLRALEHAQGHSIRTSRVITCTASGTNSTWTATLTVDQTDGVLAVNYQVSSSHLIVDTSC